MSLVWLSLGIIIGVWAGWHCAHAQWHAVMASHWEEMNRRLLARHGQLTSEDWVEVFGAPAEAIRRKR